MSSIYYKYHYIPKEVLALYDDISNESNGYRKVIVRNQGIGFIDAHTYREKIPMSYEDAKDFKEGYANVKKDGKWGLIDKKNNLIIEMKCDTFMKIKEKIQLVQIKDQWVYFNLEADKYIPTRDFSECSSFSENYAAVRVRDKWGYIDRQGMFFIKPIFESASSFIDGKAVVNLDTICDGSRLNTMRINKKGRVLECSTLRFK